MDTLINILSSHPSVKYGSLLLAYMGLVRHLRYRRINALLRKYPDPTLPLRNLTIAREVVGNLSDLEFPYINVVSLEFALFKTYAIPSISKILVATKQFTNNCLRRTDDTVLILLEMNEGHSRNVRRTMLEGGKEDEEEVLNDERRREIAAERLNFLHGHYNIKQGDYLYTLAQFIQEPAVFIDKFEWRETTLLEKNALLALWIFNGKNMGIKDIPETLDELKAWADAYEEEHSQYDPANPIIADVTIDLLLGHQAPKFMHPFGRKAIAALLTPRLRKAFGMPAPPAGLTTIMETALKARGLFIRYFMLPRRLPRVRTALRVNEHGKYVPAFHKYGIVYGDGYRVEDLGPEKFVGKCPISFHPSGITPATGHSSSLQDL
ncbi:hypothetical protein BG015_009725 [Linnemannia schmuckeri]|uniref:ER-bound oxygenase mpaB/mpaB'/Rubber oxygenase catalytic domain-containing protein n=1 Tax=Linnemannia schmuckeri TaxID=64567 RepID=A0A9P5V9L2_9FUNG|nr:hypothetical protein BG015_009725 [Linnemannia schmuckeri]